MHDFSQCNCREGSSNILLLLSRLTVIRPFEKGDPFSLLIETLNALNAGDILACISSYHKLTSALIHSKARRVSGDVWRDYLLYLLIETPHAFAKAAAAGIEDEPLYSAMRTDLCVLGTLSSLKDEDIRRFALEKQHDTKLSPHRNDPIGLASTSAWSGAPVRHTASNTQSTASFITTCEADYISWQYDNALMHDEYVCDETLEEIYLRFLQTADWRPFAEDLWSFFSSYGCGDFIKHKLFTYDCKKGLVPLPSLAEREALFPVSFYEMQHRKALEHTISFMQGSRVENMLICGGAATGKTELLLSLCDELPELRLVLCNAASCTALSELFEAISCQPLRFMVLLDNIRFDSDEADTLFSTLECTKLLPKNVLLCATSRSRGEERNFPLCITMPYPTLNDFVDIISEILSQYDVRIQSELIRSRCIDYQAEAKEKLSLSAAKRIADEYIKKQGGFYADI